MCISADSYSIYKIGLFKSTNKKNFNHTSLDCGKIMYEFEENVKDKHQRKYLVCPEGSERYEQDYICKM